jgi:hypothetical protein
MRSGKSTISMLRMSSAREIQSLNTGVTTATSIPSPSVAHRQKPSVAEYGIRSKRLHHCSLIATFEPVRSLSSAPGH